ncbi:MAG: hypothetical protein HYX90_12395 [Chloroflexi bacterium]|nr:hypothetical protein [Chloroflexota bacterium]
MNLNKWHALVKAMNFESAAYAVFQRLILGEGPGLLVVWGGQPNEPVKANKSYFLDMVESFQNGMTVSQEAVPDSLRDLFGQLKPGQYQCVRVAKQYLLLNGKPYHAPLAVAVTTALATTAQRPGLEVGRHVVLLCDDLHAFMYDKSNGLLDQIFLKRLAQYLDNQKSITFLGASQLGWAANKALDAELPGTHTLPLGWD